MLILHANSGHISVGTVNPHLSIQCSDVWVQGLLSFSFFDKVVRILARKICQNRYGRGRKIAWSRAS